MVKITEARAVHATIVLMCDELHSGQPAFTESGIMRIRGKAGCFGFNGLSVGRSALSSLSFNHKKDRDDFKNGTRISSRDSNRRLPNKPVEF